MDDGARSRYALVLGVLFCFLCYSCGGGVGNEKELYTCDSVIHGGEVASVYGANPDSVINGYLDDARDDIYVIANSKQIRFFINADLHDPNRYVEYCLNHVIVPAKNTDIWGLYKVYETQKSGFFDFVREYNGNPIVTDGIWELAIKESGADGFVGMRHGSERLSDARFFCDDKEVYLDEDVLFRCQLLRFVQTSVLYHDNNLVPLAEHSIKYVIDRNAIDVSQYIEFIDDARLLRSFASMLPIRRNLYGKTGELITDKGERNDGTGIEDISTPSFPLVYTMNTNAATVWGTESGIMASVQILESPDLPNENFHFSNSGNYNKLYFDMSRNYNAHARERWAVRSRYVITTGNEF
jgi:hypothetical protein